MSLACTRCGRTHELEGPTPGQTLTCECGQQLRVPVDATTVEPAASTRLFGAKAQGVTAAVIAAARSDATVAATPIALAADPQGPQTAPASTPAASGASGQVLPSGALDATVVPSRSNPAVGSAAGGSGPVAAGPAITRPGEDQTLVRNISTPRLPGFELIELLGRGGMGEVWRARQLSLGRTVAVKLLPEHLAHDPEFVARFDKEATALATLSHPNVVQIIDRGREGEHYYFVMELVEGRSLRERLEAGRPSHGEALRLLLQIARALEAAHEGGIIHRDLKPENVLLDARGHAKVADFGLAGFREDRSASHQLTASRVAMGTLNYMAPEQRREARSVDGRADLYSLGVILYELFTGDLPIGRFAPISRKDPTVDPSLDGIAEHLLAYEPDERYATATPLIADLEVILSRTSQTSSTAGSEGLVTGSRAVTMSGNTTLPLQVGRARRWAPVAAALVLLGLGFGVWKLRTSEAAPGMAYEAGDEGGALLTIPGVQQYPPNSDDELLATLTEEPLGGGRTRLSVAFAKGEEPMSVYEGFWRFDDGALRSTQAGNASAREGGALRPRAYLSDRYFGADDFDASAVFNLRELEAPYAPEPANTRFAELSFRVTGLQVSVLAIPGTGLRLQWQYRGRNDEVISGSSQEDIDQLMADVFPVPKGPFRLRLTLEKARGGVLATGWVHALNATRADGSPQRRAIPFARKVLPGLQGGVAKLALGCRNLDCTFTELVLEGAPRAPARRPAASAAEKPRTQR